MADLIGFNSYLNVTAPFSPGEYRVQYKTEQKYLDFSYGNTYNATCEYPRFWNETGNVLPKNSAGLSDLVGCFDSDFDQVRINRRWSTRVSC